MIIKFVDFIKQFIAVGALRESFLLARSVLWVFRGEYFISHLFQKRRGEKYKRLTLLVSLLHRFAIICRRDS